MGGGQPSGDRYTDLWCLLNPKTGTITIEVSFTGNFLSSFASSFIGVGLIDGGASNTSGSATSFTLTSVTTQANAWVVEGVHNSACSTITAGTGTTIRQNPAGQCFAISDSNSALSAGSNTQNYTATAGTWAGGIAALEPNATHKFQLWPFSLF